MITTMEPDDAHLQINALVAEAKVTTGRAGLKAGVDRASAWVATEWASSSPWQAI